MAGLTASTDAALGRAAAGEVAMCAGSGFAVFLCWGVVLFGLGILGRPAIVGGAVGGSIVGIALAASRPGTRLGPLPAALAGAAAAAVCYGAAVSIVVAPNPLVVDDPAFAPRLLVAACYHYVPGGLGSGVVAATLSRWFARRRGRGTP